MPQHTMPPSGSGKVSVYIVSRNYGRFLEEAIESVLRQSYKDWELLLINDASSDATEEIMARYANLPEVRLLRGEGLGLARAANLALTEAKGEYVIRLDADDVFDENILLVLVNHLAANPRMALTFPDYYLIDEFGHIFANERRVQVHYKNHMQDMPPHGACTMFRTAVLRAVGGYREDLKAQDGFYIWSQVKDNYRCGNVNLPLFYYRRHSHNMTGDVSRILQARRTIKRESCRVDLANQGPLLAVIPCRQNFDAVPDLWKETIGNKSLLSIAIEKCLASSIFDSVMVTCDNPEAKEVVDRYNDPRLGYVHRATDATIPSRPLVDTLEHVLFESGIGDRGLTILCYVQSPLTSTETLEEAAFTLVGNDADSSFTAEEISSPLFTRTPHGLLQFNNTGYLYSDFNIVYRELKNVLAVRNKVILRGSLTGARSVHYVITEDERLFVNSRCSLEVARVIHQAQKRPSTTPAHQIDGFSRRTTTCAPPPPSLGLAASLDDTKLRV